MKAILKMAAVFLLGSLAAGCTMMPPAAQAPGYQPVANSHNQPPTPDAWRCDAAKQPAQSGTGWCVGPVPAAAEPASAIPPQPAACAGQCYRCDANRQPAQPGTGWCGPSSGPAQVTCATCRAAKPVAAAPCGTCGAVKKPVAEARAKATIGDITNNVIVVIPKIPEVTIPVPPPASTPTPPKLQGSALTPAAEQI